MKRIMRFSKEVWDMSLWFWEDIKHAWAAARHESRAAMIDAMLAQYLDKEDACPGPVDAEPSSDTPPVSG